MALGRGTPVVKTPPAASRGTWESGTASRSPEGATRPIAWLDVQGRIRRGAERDRWREPEGRERARSQRKRRSLSASPEGPSPSARPSAPHRRARRVRSASLRSRTGRRPTPRWPLPSPRTSHRRRSGAWPRALSRARRQPAAGRAPRRPPGRRRRAAARWRGLGGSRSSHLPHDVRAAASNARSERESSPRRSVEATVADRSVRETWLEPDMRMSSPPCPMSGVQSANVSEILAADQRKWRLSRHAAQSPRPSAARAARAGSRPPRPRPAAHSR